MRLAANTGRLLEHFAKSLRTDCLSSLGYYGGNGPQWIFLGPPGVGKGTYSKRIANFIKVPHISTGDLVRLEISKGSEFGNKIQRITSQGCLLPDDVIFKMLSQRLKDARNGFVLDGFPRTLTQAKRLQEIADVHLVINLDLREEVLVAKCLGRRICSKCKKEFNLADIYLKPSDNRPEIIMPPMPPPKECLCLMTQREDDVEEVVSKRIKVYRSQAAPIEEYYRNLGVLLDFEITGGIPHTLPVLLKVLHDHMPNKVSIEEQEKMVAHLI